MTEATDVLDEVGKLQKHLSCGVREVKRRCPKRSVRDAGVELHIGGLK
jgi:hypothetical protein